MRARPTSNNDTRDCSWRLVKNWRAMPTSPRDNDSLPRQNKQFRAETTHVPSADRDGLFFVVGESRDSFSSNCFELRAPAVDELSTTQYFFFTTKKKLGETETDMLRVPDEQRGQRHRSELSSREDRAKVAADRTIHRWAMNQAAARIE